MGNLYSFILILSFAGLQAQQTYRAGVYAHRVVQPKETTRSVSRKEAVVNMMENIKIYSSVATQAKNRGVQILVFPEDGIYGFNYTRIGIRPYLEYIPNPDEEKWNPCQEPDRYNNTEIQRSLSCLASSNNMYIVANMGDYQPCDRTMDLTCPDDNHYQFNTNVVYHPDGTLIARYHKTHLYHENQFDPASQTEEVYFETPFGRFGVFICFDILFKNPGIDLVEKYNISNFVYPAAWWDSIFNTVSVFNAIQFHSAFAMAMKVNLLAANIQLPEDGFHGSGIYTPRGYNTYYYSKTPNETKLLISDVNILGSNELTSNSEEVSTMTLVDDNPIQNDETMDQDLFDKLELLRSLPRRHTKYRVKENIILKTPQHTRSANNMNTSRFKSFYVRLMGDTYTLRILQNDGDSVAICSNKLCCQLNYQMMETSGNLVAFGAFDGLHTYKTRMYLQVCILLECAGNTTQSCGQLAETTSLHFGEIRMAGNFTSKYTFPEILLSYGRIAALPSPSSSLFEYRQGTLDVFNGFELPILSVSLLSRDYSQD